MARDSSRRIKFVVVFAALIALAYIGLLFLPYFRVLNTQTGQLYHSVTGFSVAFGNSSDHVKGSNILIIAEIGGAAGGFITFVFMLLFLFKKNESPFMYFLLGLSIPCIAMAIASNFLAGPLFLSINKINNKALVYSPFLYVSVVLSILSFVTNAFILIYASLSGRRHR